MLDGTRRTGPAVSDGGEGLLDPLLVRLIERVLASHFPAPDGAPARPAAQIIRFDAACLRPRLGDVDMIMARMERAGLIAGAHIDPVAARRVFRPDAYDRAVGTAAA